VTLQCPSTSTAFSKGTRNAGRRERESRREGRREQSLRERKKRVPSRVVAVESILVCWTAALFAGRRQRVDLGRSVGCAGYLPTWRRADDSGCSKEAVEGNDVKHAPQSVCARRKHERSLHALTRTRPSLGPSARARQSSLRTRRKSSGGAYESASRLGKPGEPGGTSTGVGTNGRSATRRMSPSSQGEGRGMSRTGRRSRPSSLRGSESRGLVARTSKCSCRSR
jgi:hypothetical protein